MQLNGKAEKGMQISWCMVYAAIKDMSFALLFLLQIEGNQRANNAYYHLHYYSTTVYFFASFSFASYSFGWEGGTPAVRDLPWWSGKHSPVFLLAGSNHRFALFRLHPFLASHQSLWQTAIPTSLMRLRRRTRSTRWLIVRRSNWYFFPQSPQTFVCLIAAPERKKRGN